MESCARGQVVVLIGEEDLGASRILVRRKGRKRIFDLELEV